MLKDPRRLSVSILLINKDIVLYRMIDAENRNQMRFEELHEIIKWSLKGIGKLLMIKTPKASEIQIVSYKAFVSADANNDNNIDFTELINWIELNMKFINFLNEYEPTQHVIYDKKIFSSFPKIDIVNFELDPLNIVIDANRLVKALTKSMKNRFSQNPSMKRLDTKETTEPTISDE